jgi:riboflavin biosynthesis pyrimidine reductase
MRTPSPVPLAVCTVRRLPAGSIARRCWPRPRCWRHGCSRSPPHGICRPAAISCARRAAFADAGVDVVEVPEGPDHTVDLAAAMMILAESGITRILVEGGAHLAAALLRAGLVDRLVWFRAPRLIGGDGLPAAVGFGVDHLSQTPRFELVEARSIGADQVEFYRSI